MNLKTTQQLLARLYTDGALRQRFFAQPLTVARELRIGPDDARSLQSLSAEQVAGFARSLRGKRVSELRKALPATCRALGRHLEPLFEVFSESGPPETNPGRRLLDEALAFAEFLSSRDGSRLTPGATAPAEAPADACGTAPYRVADLARYEAIWLKFRCGRTWLLLALFHSDPRELVNGGPAPSREQARLVAIWIRFAGHLRHLALRVPRLSPSRPHGYRMQKCPPASQIGKISRPRRHDSPKWILW